MPVELDSSATEIFINQSFVEKYYLNTYKLLKPVLLYNINSTITEITRYPK